MNDDPHQKQTTDDMIDLVRETGQDNEATPDESELIVAMIARVEALQGQLESRFLNTEEKISDYKEIELIAQEIEDVAQKIEKLPVTSLSVANKKVSFYMNLIQLDHPDPDKVKVFMDKIQKVMVDYAKCGDAKKFS